MFRGTLVGRSTLVVEESLTGTSYAGEHKVLYHMLYLESLQTYIYKGTQTLVPSSPSALGNTHTGTARFLSTNLKPSCLQLYIYIFFFPHYRSGIKSSLHSVPGPHNTSDLAVQAWGIRIARGWIIGRWIAGRCIPRIACHQRTRGGQMRTGKARREVEPTRTARSKKVKYQNYQNMPQKSR